MQSVTIKPEQLGQFRPLCFLRKGELGYLADQLHLEHARAGERIVHKGSHSPHTLYVMHGQVEVVHEDGQRSTVSAGTEKGTEPISHLLPHRYDVTAVTDVDYFLLRHDLLDQLILQQNQPDGAATSSGISPQLWSHPLFFDIYRKLENDTLNLPPMPEVALRIQKLRPDEDLHKAAKIIKADAAVALVLIKIANSPFYYRQHPVTTVEQALSLLGMVRAKSYVTSFAVGQLHQSKSPAIRHHLQHLWQHSIEVAAISYALARRQPRRFDADHALLLGLVHDIGVLPILCYAEQNHMHDPHALESAITELHGETGKLIMHKWNFPDDFKQVSVEADRWMRDGAEEPDYCDIVLVAQMLSFLGQQFESLPGIKPKHLPPIVDVPAFRKLGLDGLAPDACLDLIKSAHADMADTMKLVK